MASQEVSLATAYVPTPWGKFVDSDDFPGTSAARWALNGRAGWRRATATTTDFDAD
jgi:hypothetical protein